MADDRNRDTLTYSLGPGGDAARFSIDENTGELSFVSAPDFENPQSVRLGIGQGNLYEVEIVVEDSTGRSNSQVVQVNVANVEEAPAITTSTGSNIITLTNPSGTTGVTIITTDPENDIASVTLSGDDEGTTRFFLSGDSLQAQLLGPDEDFNGDGVYELTVTATDDAGNITTLDLFVGVVGGTNGVPLFPEDTPSEVVVTEGETAVGTFSAFDVDGDGITYSLTGSDDDADFTIDPATGALTFDSAPSYIVGTTEGENTYRVTITANDGTDTTDHVLDITVAYNVTAGPATLTNFNSEFTFPGASDVPESGEILDFRNLFSGIDGAPTDIETAFADGWLNLKSDGSDIVVQFDSDGGGNDYVDILTLDNGVNTFISEDDTALFTL